jgi:tRNA dimethylallyltransferase
MRQQLLIGIQQYAKRQMTYFRKMEKEGKQIHWIDTQNGINADTIDKILIQFQN